MAQSGYKVIGIVEVGGGLYKKDGIDMEALWAFRERAGTIHGFPGAEKYDPAELLLTECDILIPAATENQITSQNADRVKCKILAEGANGPTTAAADAILSEKKVFVIPDILANAGGSRPLTLSGCRIARGISGRNRKLMSVWEISWLRRSTMSSVRGRVFLGLFLCLLGCGGVGGSVGRTRLRLRHSRSQDDGEHQTESERPQSKFLLRAIHFPHEIKRH